MEGTDLWVIKTAYLCRSLLPTIRTLPPCTSYSQVAIAFGYGGQHRAVCGTQPWFPQCWCCCHQDVLHCLQHVQNQSTPEQTKQTIVFIVIALRLCCLGVTIIWHPDLAFVRCFGVLRLHPRRDERLANVSNPQATPPQCPCVQSGA